MLCRIECINQSICTRNIGRRGGYFTHYSKSQIFVQKFNFDLTPSFSPNTFLTIFLVKSKLSTAKMSKTTTFSQVFHPQKVDNVLGKSKDKKLRYRTVWLDTLFSDVFYDCIQTFSSSFQVRYTAYRDRPLHERQTKFICSLREGHTEIVRKLWPWSQHKFFLKISKCNFHVFCYRHLLLRVSIWSWHSILLLPSILPIDMSTMKKNQER